MKNYLLLSVLVVFNITISSVMPNHAQEKNCIYTEAGKKICGTTIKENEPESQPSSRSSVDIVSQNNEHTLNVRLQKCTKKASNVSCKFTMVKTDGDKAEPIYFYASAGERASLLIDMNEEEYAATDVAVNNYRSPIAIPPIIGKNQPFSLVLSFKVTQEIQTIKELRLPIWFYYSGHEMRMARFFNIKINN